ncbi:hypothetical protein KA036_00800 [Candidatus Gracilibacteria bacterium]|jgi:hypothetical protein|nr:hypothetical protein [Candidatus Gracilibacteria bacterium]
MVQNRKIQPNLKEPSGGWRSKDTGCLTVGTVSALSLCILGYLNEVMNAINKQPNLASVYYEAYYLYHSLCNEDKGRMACQVTKNGYQGAIIRSDTMDATMLFLTDHSVTNWTSCIYDIGGEPQAITVAQNYDTSIGVTVALNLNCTGFECPKVPRDSQGFALPFGLNFFIPTYGSFAEYVIYKLCGELKPVNTNPADGGVL